MNMDLSVLPAPCDGLLSAYPITDSLVIPVKGSRYSIRDLVRDEELAKKYEDGTCLVFRLCVHHYHRYAYPDNGRKTKNTFIPGVLHTVRPVALRELPVFTENAREYTVIRSENFGDVLQMEVDGGGGPQANGLANLPDRRGIPLRLDAGGNIIIDPLLHGRKHEMTSILLAASGSCAGAMYLTVSIP